MAEDIWVTMKTQCPYCRSEVIIDYNLSLPTRKICFKCKKEFQIYYKPMAMKYPKAIGSSPFPNNKN